MVFMRLVDVKETEIPTHGKMALERRVNRD
jgi:hypothetical protein